MSSTNHLLTILEGTLLGSKGFFPRIHNQASRGLLSEFDKSLLQLPGVDSDEDEENRANPEQH